MTKYVDESTGVSYDSSNPSSGLSLEGAIDPATLAGMAGPSTSRVLGAEGSFTPQGNNGILWEVGDANAYIASLPSLELGVLQGVLSSSGLLPDGYREGNNIDPGTIRAYETVLTMSNVNDVEPKQVVRQLATYGFGAKVAEAAKREAARREASGPTRQPFSATVSNAEDLRSFFQSQLVEMTGQDRGSVDVDQMVTNYQAEQQNAQARSYNAAPTGGVTEAAPSVEGYAEREIAGAAPVQTQANNVVDRAGQLFDMLGTFGGR